MMNGILAANPVNVTRIGVSQNSFSADGVASRSGGLRGFPGRPSQKGGHALGRGAVRSSFLGHPGAKIFVETSALKETLARTPQILGFVQTRLGPADKTGGSCPNEIPPWGSVR